MLPSKTVTPLAVRWPSPGRYILAVSGGADSMVLLDLFARAAKTRGYELTVAHFDHGVRPDSPLDLELIAQAARAHGLPVKSKQAKLTRASEATARTARHGWLEDVRVACDAAAILTAHHEDDLLETSLLNLARGTGRLGLAPMGNTSTILRPLIATGRAALRAYATKEGVAWREDSTNTDISNPRNFLRHVLLPAGDSAWRKSYLELIAEMAELNKKIDQSISGMLDAARVGPDVYSFPVQLIRASSVSETEELILAAARRLRPGIQLDQRLIRETALFAATGQPRKFRPLRQDIILSLTRDSVNLTTKSAH